MTTTYTGQCPKCGHKQTREWKGEPWVGYDGEASFAADCHECGPGVELTMFPEEPEEEREMFGLQKQLIQGFAVSERRRR